MTGYTDDPETKVIFRSSLERPFAKALLLNRQFYQESLPIAYGVNTFNFNNALSLSIWLRSIGQSSKYIKNITLEFDMTQKLCDFICLLDLLQDGRQSEHYRTMVLTIFQRLPKVEKLNIQATLLRKDKIRIRRLRYYYYWFSLYCLHLDKPNPPQQYFLQVDFTLPKSGFVAAQDTKSASTKSLSDETRESIARTSWAVWSISNSY